MTKISSLSYCLIFVLTLSFNISSNAQTVISSNFVTLDAPNDMLGFGIADDGCVVTALPNSFPGDVTFDIGLMVDTNDPTLGVNATINYMGAIVESLIITEATSGTVGSYSTACGESFEISYSIEYEPLPGPFDASSGESRAIVMAGISTVVPTVPSEAIPTMGEWVLVILSLCLLIYGVISIRERRPQLA